MPDYVSSWLYSVATITTGKTAIHILSLCVYDADNHVRQGETKGTILPECRCKQCFSVLHHCWIAVAAAVSKRPQALSEGCAAKVDSNVLRWPWCKRGTPGLGQSTYVRNNVTWRSIASLGGKPLGEEDGTSSVKELHRNLQDSTPSNARCFCLHLRFHLMDIKTFCSD